jgi:hypothetical protein
MCSNDVGGTECAKKRKSRLPMRDLFLTLDVVKLAAPARGRRPRWGKGNIHPVFLSSPTDAAA